MNPKSTVRFVSLLPSSEVGSPLSVKVTGRLAVSAPTSVPLSSPLASSSGSGAGSLPVAVTLPASAPPPPKLWGATTTM